METQTFFTQIIAARLTKLEMEESSVNNISTLQENWTSYPFEFQLTDEKFTTKAIPFYSRYGLTKSVKDNHA
ncbi:hypothetical protein PHET_09705 [Paragonimus heterotremus]|uniref:Uncharacterized protein n=1 Tax=Paragonimus heterotremus TaxID=100268 RepID=A0A8J4T2X9_9TREM|nr:hypothetical protein PHET_09705 [Paragonimus heterotremus]